MKTDRFQNKYRIESARAKWGNYNEGLFYVTICTEARYHFFGEIVDDSMIKNELGIKVEELIIEISLHQPYAHIIEYTVMPNHLHLIVQISNTNKTINSTISIETKNDSKSVNMQTIAQRASLLSIAMGGLKSALTRYANDNKIRFGWQARFHDHIIRNDEELNRITDYIRRNVETWEEDDFFTI